MLEIRPEWSGLRGGGVGMPEAKRLENLRTWRPGAVSRAGILLSAKRTRVPGEGGAEFQVFSFPGSGRPELAPHTTDLLGHGLRQKYLLRLAPIP